LALAAEFGRSVALLDMSTMQPRRIAFVLAVLISVNAFSCALFAEARSLPKKKSNGRVSGVVVDVNDARVVGAKVAIKGHNYAREVLSGDAGQFSVDLRPGEYHFTVDASGFCKFQSNILTIKSGVTETINIHLDLLINDNANPCKCMSWRTRS
jgi:hypothetical protein